MKTEANSRTEYPANQVSGVLWNLYSPASLPQRALATLRPYICPFGPVLEQTPENGRVLDIGCGNGLVLAVMAHFRRITEGVGVEINPRPLETGAVVSARGGLPLRFQQASDSGDWPRETFGTVSMIDVLHHVPREGRESFIAAALERVAPGGRFLLKDMTSSPWWRVRRNQFHDLVMARQRVEVEPMENVVRWVEARGFRMQVQKSYSACGLYGHELAVFDRPR